jgi:hypothetical protein
MFSVTTRLGLVAAEAGKSSMYQAVNPQATTVHELFVTAMENSAGSYAAAEAADAVADS